MSLNNLLEQANSHVVEVNKLMGDVEMVENIINAVKEPNLVISFTQRGVGTTYIDDTLTEEELRSLKETVMVCIMRNRDDKVAKLEKLLGIRKPATINPEFEAAVQDMVKQVKKPSTKEIPVSSYKPYYDEGKLRRAFAEDKSVKQIAEEFGCAPCNVYDGMRKFGIEVKHPKKSRVEKAKEKQEIIREAKPEPVKPKLTVEEVKRIYTNGTANLTEAATYFGVDKKELYDFVTENHILKPVAPKDPFVRANKMSKDELRAALSKGRK